MEEAKESQFLNRMADLLPVIETISKEAGKIQLPDGDLRDVDLEALFSPWLPGREPTQLAYSGSTVIH